MLKTNQRCVGKSFASISRTALTPRIRTGLGLVGVSVLVWTTSACTWVSVSPEGQRVRVASLERAVEGCKRVGQIRARTTARIGLIERNEETVQEELEGLAKNDAVEMGANVILPEGPVSEAGERKFGAYRCPLD